MTPGSAIITHDGTCLLFDPDVGVVSGRNRAEAEAEARRLARRAPPAHPAHTHARETLSRKVCDREEAAA